MGERYRKWLEDPDARQILEGFNAHNLDDPQQTAFEELVDSHFGEGRPGNMKSSEAQARMRLIAKSTGNRRQVNWLVSDFKAAIRDRNLKYRGAKDPHVIEGFHRRGVDGPSR